MTTSCLQEKIDKLQNTVHALLHKSNYMAGVYVDDLARLNIRGEKRSVSICGRPENG